MVVRALLTPSLPPKIQDSTGTVLLKLDGYILAVTRRVSIGNIQIMTSLHVFSSYMRDTRL